MNKRKELLEQYKARAVTGAVVRVVNRKNGRFSLLVTDDLRGEINRLNFSKMTDSPLKPSMAADWKEFGRDAFELEEIDHLEKKPEQTLEEFRAELEVLYSLWDERFPAEGRY
jgi:hypothetical protein